MSYCLAIDIGASSGRHLLGEIKDGKIVCEEIYRFENGMEMKNNHLCWNAGMLVNHVIAV